MNARDVWSMPVTGAFEPIDFGEIRKRVNLRDLVVKELGEPGRGGRWKCPFHPGDNGGNPTAFKITPDKQHAHCFVCDWSGDAFDFYASRHSIGVDEAA